MTHAQTTTPEFNSEQNVPLATRSAALAGARAVLARAIRREKEQPILGGAAPGLDYTSLKRTGVTQDEYGDFRRGAVRIDTKAQMFAHYRAGHFGNSPRIWTPEEFRDDLYAPDNDLALRYQGAIPGAPCVYNLNDCEAPGRQQTFKLPRPSSGSGTFFGWES